MSAKISASRRAAFVKALGETGNITVSAERTGVSRNWAMAQRKRDPEFDAACRSALARARASFEMLRRSGGVAPPSGWGFLDGVELVVRGSGGSGGGRRVQIARARVRQWTPRAEDRFLGVLAATCNVKAACAAVGMWPPSAYNHRKRWPAFAARWDAAIEEGYARLEIGLIEAACNLFSRAEVTPDAAIAPISAAEAIHILHMHKHEARGMGRRPGLPPRRPTFEEVRPGIVAKVEAIRRARTLSEADKARDREQWALRRGWNSPSTGA